MPILLTHIHLLIAAAIVVVVVVGVVLLITLWPKKQCPAGSGDAVSHHAKVAQKSEDHGLKDQGNSHTFVIDDNEQHTLMGSLGDTVRIDVSDRSFLTLDFRLSFYTSEPYFDKDQNKFVGEIYENEGHIIRHGTPGTANAYVEVIVDDTLPSVLYYDNGDLETAAKAGGRFHKIDPNKIKISEILDMPRLEDALNDISPSDLVIAVGFKKNETLVPYQSTIEGPPVVPAVQGPNARPRYVCTDGAGCVSENSTISLTTKMYTCNLMEIDGITANFKTSQSPTGAYHQANSIFIKCTADGSGTALNTESPDLHMDTVHAASWSFYANHSGIITRNELTGLTYMPFQSTRELHNSPLSCYSPLHGIDQFVCDGTFFDEDKVFTGAQAQDVRCQFALFDAEP